MKQKHAYKLAVEEIRQLKEKHPHLTRADRFKILEEHYGIEEETAREADRLLRAIREVFPKDEVGAELEQEWQMPDYLRPLDENKAWNDMFKRNGLDA